jgi:CRP-like cAMP-binding protein
MLAQLRQRYSYLTDEQWNHFSSFFQRLEVPAKTILLREGAIASKAYIIEKGCLRVWFDNKGRDTTFQFFFEGQGISSIESFRKNIPSFVTIETLEPCILYWIRKKDLEYIRDEIEKLPGHENLLLDFMFERQLYYMKEFLSFVRDTPAERYQRLIAERPHIVQRVPQQYIASYLGITSVSLSRIKARLAKEGKKG